MEQSYAAFIFKLCTNSAVNGFWVCAEVNVRQDYSPFLSNPVPYIYYTSQISV